MNGDAIGEMLAAVATAPDGAQDDGWVIGTAAVMPHGAVTSVAEPPRRPTQGSADAALPDAIS